MKLPGKRASASGNSTRSTRSDEAQSEETLRARARSRLIGAVVLVMTGVVVFPLIFETQPKPVASSMNLVMPPQTQASAVRPILPASHAASAAAVAKPVAAAATVAATASASGASHASTVTAKAQPRPQPKPPASVPVRHDKPQQLAPATAAPAQLSAGARAALAALEGTSGASTTSASGASAAAASQRFVVQAGAFADARAAHKLLRKIDAAGLHAYTQKIDTRHGHRWRVRVGPFASHALAAKAQAHLKTMGISADVLSL